MSGNDHEKAGLKGAVDKAQDMIGGVVGMSSAATGARDAAAFATNAGIGDLYEIEAARIALQRSRSDGVRAFAAMMAEHHTTSKHQMQSALSSSEVRREHPDLLPAMELDQRRQGMIDNLLDAPDDDFDARYLDQQRMAHRETASLLEGFVEHGTNPQLRSFAMGGLPMVRRHLKALQNVGAH